MATSILTDSDDFVETTDDESEYWTDSSNNGGWDEIQLMTEEDKITINSQNNANLITKSDWEECWQCTKCLTINNVSLCIKKYGSKCLGCKDECYIKSQTETILKSKWDETDIKYSLLIGELWQCESCRNVNNKSNENCTKCNKPSAMTAIRRKIAKFTDEEKMDHLIHGFVRVHEYYLEINIVHVVLFKIIQKFYVIDYVETGWIIGDIKCMSKENALKLSKGDYLDYKDSNGKFKMAEVKGKMSFLGLKIQFEGDSTESWTWNKYGSRFAEAGAVSSRPGHRLHGLKVGDKVDINPIYIVSLIDSVNTTHSGWKHGEIKKLDKNSGQVKVQYEYADTKFNYWIHVDNMDEIAEYQSMTSKIGMTLCDLLQRDINDKEKGDMNYIWE